LAWLGLCAVQDIRQRHLANGLTLGGALLALGYLLWAGNTWLGADAVEGGRALLLALLLTVPGYVLGRMGGGDVKLLAALGLASDPLHLLGTFIGAALASGLWWLLAPRLLPAADQPLARSLQYLDPRQGQKYAFAPFVLVGMALTLIWARYSCRLSLCT